MPLKLLPLVAAETGYTENALRCKIQQGVLVEGREYFRSPDGKIAFDTEKFEQWQRNEIQSVSER